MMEFIETDLNITEKLLVTDSTVYYEGHINDHDYGHFATKWKF